MTPTLVGGAGVAVEVSIRDATSVTAERAWYMAILGVLGGPVQRFGDDGVAPLGGLV